VAPCLAALAAEHGEGAHAGRGGRGREREGDQPEAAEHVPGEETLGDGRDGGLARLGARAGVEHRGRRRVALYRAHGQLRAQGPVDTQPLDVERGVAHLHEPGGTGDGQLWGPGPDLDVLAEHLEVLGRGERDRGGDADTEAEQHEQQRRPRTQLPEHGSPAIPPVQCSAPVRP
jgi:hypothetical protein